MEVLSLVLALTLYFGGLLFIMFWWNGYFCRKDIKCVSADGPKLADPRYWFETNDCSVKALAIAGAMEYHEAYNVLAALGRTKNEGVYTEAIVGRAIGCRKAIRLGKLRWFANNRKGRWIAIRTGHAFAIVDGVIYDSVAPRPDERLVAAIRLI